MKHFILILSLIFISFKGSASHIVGGEIYYDCLGNNVYKVTIKLYRDCLSDGAQYDSPLPLGVFRNSDNSLFSTYSVAFPGSTLLPVEFSNPCVNPPTNICVQEAIYQTNISLPPSPEGYTLVYERCCRGPGILNLTNPESEGLTLTAHVPGTNSGITCNSSPRFKETPPLLLCNNEELIFDHSAIDPDGDQIVYELCTPYHGGSPFDPAPNPPNNPPYNFVNWENGFNQTTPFGANGPINIDPNTGLLTASPDMIGKYVVAVCANEYRNGNLISTTRRDFIFTVFNCEITLSADIVPQEQLQTFNSYCQGLTIAFENDSYGGTNYLWDFGVTNDPNATSTSFTPTYTFPSEGVYEVTLIVNPGWPCSDTSVETFTVYESLQNYFDPPPPQCITGNSFDFEGEGDYQAGATFVWDFGSNANIPSATTEDVNNIVFDTSGYIPITYTVNWNVCSGTYTDSVFVYMEPTINFGIDAGLYCAPFTAHFKDSSAADAPLTYLWDFGDGNTSVEPNPVHVYENPGIYDVSLIIETSEGCIGQLTLEKPGLIEVFPSPIADFEVTPSVTNVFETEITFTDYSFDSDYHFYQLNDSVDTTERNLTYHFLEGGYHYPYQVVTNEFGCKDTAYRQIYVEPYTTYYIPNAFTPNQDGRNEVFRPIVYDVTDYTFEIYNRWGERIYETNDRTEGWNGLIHGNKAPDGVYVWRMKFRNHLSIFEEHHGHFSLLK
ncbi:MAG: PKD domain-containing protein [Brumimicrobium sp.]|nr:PKD domain-containing protein [Brumimicrobium sp.]